MNEGQKVMGRTNFCWKSTNKGNLPQICMDVFFIRRLQCLICKCLFSSKQSEDHRWSADHSFINIGLIQHFAKLLPIILLFNAIQAYGLTHTIQAGQLNNTVLDDIPGSVRCKNKAWCLLAAGKSRMLLWRRWSLVERVSYIQRHL
jgi:hypothetical protein